MSKTNMSGERRKWSLDRLAAIVSRVVEKLSEKIGIEKEERAWGMSKCGGKMGEWGKEVVNFVCNRLC